MALKVSKAEVWTTAIVDRTGGAADKIEPLTRAGANFEFVFARRTPEQPGRGLCMVAPVKGKRVVGAAPAPGVTRALDITALRIEGSNKAGSAARMMRALADAGISFRGLSAAAVGTKFVGHVAFDNAADAERAAKVLKKV